MSYLLVFKVPDSRVCLGGIIYIYKPESAINNTWNTWKSSKSLRAVSLFAFRVHVFFLTSPQMELKCSLYIEFVAPSFLQPKQEMLFSRCALGKASWKEIADKMPWFFPCKRKMVMNLMIPAWGTRVPCNIFFNTFNCVFFPPSIVNRFAQGWEEVCKQVPYNCEDVTNMRVQKVCVSHPCVFSVCLTDFTGGYPASSTFYGISSVVNDKSQISNHSFQDEKLVLKSKLVQTV